MHHQPYNVLYGQGFGRGRLATCSVWEKGDFLTLPCRFAGRVYADAGAAMYWVHDEPLLRYLGAEADPVRVSGD